MGNSLAFVKINIRHILLPLFSMIVMSMLLPIPIHADDVESTNYKIQDFSFGSGFEESVAIPDGPDGCQNASTVLIDNTSLAQSLNDYQVELSVTYQTGMQSDFSDLRFTNQSGTDLDHWIESYVASTSATVWIEVDSIPASATTYIFMWYNGCTGGNASSGSDTFLWYDDFSTDTTSNYSYADDGNSGCPGSISWYASYEAMQLNGPDNCRAYATPNSLSVKDVLFSARVRANQAYDGSGRVSMHTRYANRYSHYAYEYANAGYTSPTIQRVTSTLVSGSESMSLNTWYDWEVGAWGNNLEFWVGGTSKLNTTDSTYNTAQSVGMQANEMRTYFDDLIVRKYYEPEPTTSFSNQNYGLLTSVGGNLNDDRFSSNNYKIGIGVTDTWMANTPTIKCFETTTNGSTNCDDADINPNGMVQICGGGGCYNRARVEINAEDNPTDTLYSFQITTDSNWDSWDYIDGTTFMIESTANHDINDYLTKSSWEGTASSLNIYGLEPDTTYYLRATALHGDFTESTPSPSTSATTGKTEISFDLDIADTAGSGAENSGPYSIDLGQLAVSSVTTSSDLIWFDLSSNASGGTIVYVKDTNTGLYSPSTGHTIVSATADLDAVSEGFGLQEYTASQTSLGPLVAESDFAGSGNNIGGIATTAVQIFNTSANAITAGRGAIYIKTKVAATTPSAIDYEDDITLTVVGTY